MAKHQKECRAANKQSPLPGASLGAAVSAASLPVMLQMD
jgi:hypothetical protein